jgi:phage shock protein A
MKEHLIAGIHSKLRAVAIRFVGSEQLRERLVRVVAPLVDENKGLEQTVLNQHQQIKDLEEKMDDLRNIMCEEY